MSDIVHSLRTLARAVRDDPEAGFVAPPLREAADEIERLRGGWPMADAFRLAELMVEREWLHAREDPDEDAIDAAEAEMEAIFAAMGDDQRRRVGVMGSRLNDIRNRPIAAMRREED